eukprot:4069797-Amphidinium_carterae.1
MMMMMMMTTTTMINPWPYWCKLLSNILSSLVRTGSCGADMAARSRSCLISSLVAILGLALVLQSSHVFVPAPIHRKTAVSTLETAPSAAYAAAVSATA